MTHEGKDKYQEQIDAMRQKLDELRLKGHLLKMELRDNQDEVVEGLEKAFDVAKAKFSEFADASEKEADKLGGAFQAAWTAFKKSYDEATKD